MYLELKRNKISVLVKIEERKKSLPVLDREWDKPKLKEPMWNKIVENPQKKTELDESLVQSYTFISEIKESIKNLNEVTNRDSNIGPSLHVRS